MQEIALEAALRNGQNIWVDGSLRNSEWFSHTLDTLRSRYPEYRVAIFYVYASETRVLERCEKRATESGRKIPDWVIRESLCAPVESLRKLVVKVDFIARIKNDGPVPVLEAVETVDRSGCWREIGRKFARSDSFPPRCYTELPINFSHQVFTLL